MREAGELERKKNLRKKEKRREAREKENRKYLFNERRVIKKKKKNLASSYSTQPKIIAHCSSKTKIFSYTFTTVEPFLYFSKTKIAI